VVLVDACVEDGDHLAGAGVAGCPGVIGADDGNALGQQRRGGNVLLDVGHGRVGGQCFQPGCVDFQYDVGNRLERLGRRGLALRRGQGLDQVLLNLLDLLLLLLDLGLGAKLAFGGERGVELDNDPNGGLLLARARSACRPRSTDGTAESADARATSVG
jgi:hypothetical protein